MIYAATLAVGLTAQAIVCGAGCLRQRSALRCLERLLERDRNTAADDISQVLNSVHGGSARGSRWPATRDRVRGTLESIQDRARKRSGSR